MGKPKHKQQKPKRKPGRPSEYRPEYCDMLVKHMQEGLSFEAFAGVLHKSKETLYQWVKIYPEFADAKKKGDAESLLFWEKLGITGMVGKIKGFNVVAWIFSMKNRHGYRNDPAVDHPDEGDPVMQDAIAHLDAEERAAAPAPVVPAAPVTSPKAPDESG